MLGIVVKLKKYMEFLILLYKDVVVAEPNSFVLHCYGIFKSVTCRVQQPLFVKVSLIFDKPMMITSLVAKPNLFSPQ